MLKIINNLAPFFEDCYRRISVREYAKLSGISAPTASKLLKACHEQGLLAMREERRHLLFNTNQESRDVMDLSRIYWRKKLESLSVELQKKLVNPTGVLFGSLAKAEAKQDSDIDLAVFSPAKKQIDIAPYEAKLKRAISIYWYTSLNDIKNKHLLNNILNGCILFGNLRWN